MRLKKLACLPLFMLLTSCYYLQSTSIPIKTTHYPQQNAIGENKSDRKLIVLLPGIGDEASEFNKHGVVDVIRHIYPNTDIIAVDAF
jgi:hypothetical protein